MENILLRRSCSQETTRFNQAKSLTSLSGEQKLDYIHNNPVRSGIVINPEDYLYSSARNYACLESILDVIEVSRTWKTLKSSYKLHIKNGVGTAQLGVAFSYVAK